MRLISLSLVLLISAALISCRTAHPYPEIIEKNYSPVRSGVIQHMKPENAEEQRQYQLATIGMAKKFCKGPAKVLSEQDATVTSGTTNTFSTNTNGLGWSQSAADSADMVRVRFECPESSTKSK